jgi:hypothetical protein
MDFARNYTSQELPVISLSAAIYAQPRYELKRFHAASRIAMANRGVAHRDGSSEWCQLWMVKRSPASAKRMLRTAATG